MSPLVSVIIPVYNVEPYLEQCIESVMGQTLLEIEIICVNDGSTDGSFNILEKLQRKDPRLKIISQENLGAGAARNKGLAIAQGEYLSFLDADDFFEPDMLYTAYNRAKKFDADVVIYRADRFLEWSQQYQPIPWSVDSGKFPHKNAFSIFEITGNPYRAIFGWAWDKLFKRSFILEHNLSFQPIRIHNDLSFVYAALSLSERITFIDRVLVYQRKRGGGSLSDSRREWWCAYDALDNLRSILKDKNIYDKLSQEYIDYALHLVLYTLDHVDKSQRSKVQETLRTDWFPNLGISGQPAGFFTNPKEYGAYLRMAKLGFQERDAQIANSDVEVLLHDLAKVQAEIAAIYNSKSYRIGRIITYFPRKLRGLIRCCREHGLRYTLRLVKTKFCSLLRRKHI